MFLNVLVCIDNVIYETNYLTVVCSLFKGSELKSVQNIDPKNLTKKEKFKKNRNYFKCIIFFAK